MPMVGRRREVLFGLLIWAFLIGAFVFKMEVYDPYRLQQAADFLGDVELKPLFFGASRTLLREKGTVTLPEEGSNITTIQFARGIVRLEFADPPVPVTIEVKHPFRGSMFGVRLGDLPARARSAKVEEPYSLGWTLDLDGRIETLVCHNAKYWRLSCGPFGCTPTDRSVKNLDEFDNDKLDKVLTSYEFKRERKRAVDEIKVKVGKVQYLSWSPWMGRLLMTLRVTSNYRIPIQIAEFAIRDLRFLNPDVYIDDSGYPETLLADDGMSVEDTTPIVMGEMRTITIEVTDASYLDNSRRLSSLVLGSPFDAWILFIGTDGSNLWVKTTMSVADTTP